MKKLIIRLLTCVAALTIIGVAMEATANTKAMASPGDTPTKAPIALTDQVTPPEAPPVVTPTAQIQLSKVAAATTITANSSEAVERAQFGAVQEHVVFNSGPASGGQNQFVEQATATKVSTRGAPKDTSPGATSVTLTPPIELVIQTVPNNSIVGLQSNTFALTTARLTTTFNGTLGKQFQVNDAIRNLLTAHYNANSKAVFGYGAESARQL